MIARLAAALSRWSTRWVPDPFVIAILLTLVTMVMAWAVTGTDPLDAIGHWGGALDDGKLLPPKERVGLWSILAFAMQMCLTLVAGHALASAPLVKRGIAGVVDRASSATAALVIVALVAMVAGLLNWGLGLIVGALMARDMGRSCLRRGIRVHYPLLGAAGYTGLLVWHGGLSASAPLKISNASEIAKLPGVHLQGLASPPAGSAELATPIPLSDTIGSELNLVVCALCLVCVPLLLYLMRPKDADIQEISAFQPGEPERVALDPPTTPAQRLEQSRILMALLVAMMGAYLVMFLGKTGLDSLGLDSVNLFFLAAGLLLHGSLKAYGEAFAQGTRSCAGIILQFPFYAGIMGIMALSGLTSELAGAMTSVADDTTLGPLTFFSAGAVNLLVPSGGGQFVIQANVVIDAANQLGVPIHKAIMAFCYGDQWTNMLQPFWALPLLGITGLKVGDLIGYTAALMLLAIPLFVVPLLVL